MGSPTIKNLQTLYDRDHIQQNSFDDYEFTTIDRCHVYDIKRYRKLCKQFTQYPKGLEQINRFMYGRKKALDKNNLQHLCSYLGDIKDFFSFLQKNKITTKLLNKEEEKTPLDTLISKYNNIAALLCPLKTRSHKNQFLYSLSNSFFFFAFDEKTFSHFEQFLTRKTDHPLARFIYSVIWKNLASRGWCTWHNTMISKIKSSSINKEVIYCAGGTDIFHLLNNEIYNIRIIDPFIPTQKKFYADNWRYLLHGTIGDQLICNLPNQNLVLKRTKIENNGRFSLKNKKLIAYTTTWEVFQPNSINPCGKVIFERRPLKQRDFAVDQKALLLISFNELYFITKAREHWGIKLEHLPPNIKFFVKQLKFPITKQMLLNMKKADALETLEFIQLGSNID